jgi:hypothetical protein
MRKMVRDADVLKRYLEIGNQGRLEVRRNCVLVDNALDNDMKLLQGCS